MIAIQQKDIIERYKIYTECQKHNISVRSYCLKNDIDYKKIMNFSYRYNYKKSSDPKEYKELVAIAREFKDMKAACKISMPRFMKTYHPHISPRKLQEYLIHLDYLDIVNNYLNNDDSQIVAEELPEKKFNFLEMPSPVETPLVQDGELLKTPNDLELIITKGVKVILSGNVDTQKIIRIIELLKDL